MKHILTRCGIPVFLAFLVIAIGATAAYPQSRKTDNVYQLDDPENQAPASISQMAWLAGSWAGEGLGGDVEEMWSAPSGGTMIGSFKLVQGDEPSIYEIELMVEVGGSLEWRVKHFNPDFSAWEEKADFVSFPLVKIEEEAAYFDGLTVMKDGEDGLKVFLIIGHEGEIREETLSFRRVR